jgi:dihydroorotase-like cyclic amidohydrolase
VQSTFAGNPINFAFNDLFDGCSCKGVPIATIVAGRLVFKRNSVG